MTPSIATVSISGTLPEKLEAIAQAGYQAVELFENDLLSFSGTVREAGALASSLGLTIVTLQPFRDFEGLEGLQRQRVMDYAERKFDLMEELNTSLLMVCSSIHPDSQPGLSRTVNDFVELAERARKRGLKVAYEALAWGRHVNDYRDAWEIVRTANQPNLGLVLDTFHIFSRGSDLEVIPYIPGDQIFLVQTADAPRLSMDHLSWSRHYRCFPGQGQMDIARFMAAVEATGYAGYISHEIFNDTFRMANPRQIAQDGYRSSLYLASMHQQSSVPLKQAIESIAFIELSAPAEHYASTKQTLAALGFAQIGHHPNKPVERWAQGGINILVNRDPSFAKQWLGHDGLSVSALGVLVHDANAAERRASALGFKVIRPEACDASHQMTAMQGVDGTLTYLLDIPGIEALWSTEFPNSTVPIADGTLETVDHISVSIPYEDYLSVVLQYRAVFDLDLSPAFDITDPRGLIQSQVLSGPTPGFRFAINGSHSPQTTTNQVIRRRGGSGVQHIAFHSRSIAHTAERVAAAGAEVLAIPQNYYRDLAGKFGLAPAVIAYMERLQILFDADSSGQFQQFYVVPEGGHFLFEVVQRDGYLGLGAANAYIRASAQQQRQYHAASDVVEDPPNPIEHLKCL